MEEPLVSILIPCYNAEKWVRQCIQSALDQTYPNKEVIVVNDGSSDNSLEIIKSFDNKIKWETGSHRGANAVRNQLLGLSRGEWLQYLDADDYLEPNKIAEQVNFLQNIKNADIICSPVIVEENFSGTLKKYLLEMPDKGDFYINFIRWGSLQTSGMLWKKNALLDIGGWKDEQMVCQEHELMLRLIKGNKIFRLYNNANSIYVIYSELSTSRKSKLNTVRERMKITDELESFLGKNNLLNKKLQDEINFSRFKCARNIYSEDQKFANNLIKEIGESDNNFKPRGNAAPLKYRVVYHLFGFNFAEKIAKYFRKSNENE